MRATQKNSWLFPDYVATSVLELRPEELKKIGITHLIFDVDETVVPKAHNHLTKEYARFLQALERHGFKILIGSNSRRDLSEITKHFDGILVRPHHFSFKPLKHFFKKAVRMANVDKSQVAMVGDRIVNDVIGANNAGLTTILVEPYARKQSLLHRWYIQRLRK